MIKHDKKKNKPPIFVLGCQRSGTTVIRRILDSHPNIACPPESIFLAELSKVYETERSVAGLASMGFGEEEILNQLRAFTLYFFEQYTKSKGKPRWADKTCPYLDHVDTINAMFKKEVQYIGIVRHGLDVAYSLDSLNMGVLKPYLANGTDKKIAAVQFWKDQNIKLLDFSEKVKDRFHLIKYEELTTKPETILKPMFKFLDEPWDKRVLNFNALEHDPGFEDPKIENYKKLKPNFGNYKNWPLSTQRRLFQSAIMMFNRLGYTL
jgi:hypothetical protein